MLRKRNATNKITQGQNPLCWSEKDSQCLYWGGWNLALHWTPASLTEKLWQFKEVLLNSSSMFTLHTRYIHVAQSVLLRNWGTPHRAHRYLLVLTSDLALLFCVWDPSLSSTTSPQTAPGPAAPLLLSSHLLCIICSSSALYQNLRI